MNKKSYDDVKAFILELIIYIRPDHAVEDNTPLGMLALDDIDFTMIAIELEEKYKIIVDEKILAGMFFFYEIIDYVIALIDRSGTIIYTHNS